MLAPSTSQHLQHSRELLLYSRSACECEAPESVRTLTAKSLASEPLEYAQWKPTSRDIFAAGSALSAELEQEAASVIQDFCRKHSGTIPETSDSEGCDISVSSAQEALEIKWITLEEFESKFFPVMSTECLRQNHRQGRRDSDEGIWYKIIEEEPHRRTSTRKAGHMVAAAVPTAKSECIAAETETVWDLVPDEQRQLIAAIGHHRHIRYHGAIFERSLPLLAQAQVEISRKLLASISAQVLSMVLERFGPKFNLLEPEELEHTLLDIAVPIALKMYSNMVEIAYAEATAQKKGST